MARRRRKKSGRFAGSARQHDAQMTNAVQSATSYAEDAARAMAVRNCESSFNALTQAQFALGKAQANATQIGFDSEELRSARKQVHFVASGFRSKCVR